ncbi:MAG TPA: nuclear transport factor 2 family protein [Acidimicrobiales bacterium]|nr:nuclear transport factor 2 family protein [Acidimicrobiales bacterium]
MTDDHPRDELELRGLSTSYAAAVDFRDGVRFAALFVEGGELVVPDYPTDFRPVITRSGHEQLELIPRALEHYRCTFHQMSNHEYSIDGDAANGTVRCVAHHLTASDPTTPSGSSEPSSVGSDFIWYIRYSDDYRRVDNRWKFARRSVHLQWVEERPVLRMAPVRH